MSDALMLPAGWIKAPLSLLLGALETGGRPKGGVRSYESGVPSIGGEHLSSAGGFNFTSIRFVPEDFANQLTKGWLQQNDVLVVKDGATTGKTSYVGPDFPFQKALINEHVFICRVRSPFISKYVWYFLRSHQGQSGILLDFRGAAQGGISRSFVDKVVIPLAPVKEQKRIVSTLDELFSDLDSGMAALQRAKANLPRYRSAILKAAVEGKLTAAWRKKHADIEPASKLLERMLLERRRQWEAAKQAQYAASGQSLPEGWREKYKEPKAPDTKGLPQLPRGWCWATFDQCAWEITVGHVGPMKNKYVAQGIPFLRSQNVKPLRFEPEGITYVPKEFDKQLSKSKLLGGELLVVRSGVNFGDCCVFPLNEPQANCADLVITRLLKGVNPSLAAIFVSSPLGQGVVGVRRTGSAQPHFNVGSMKTSPFPVPPADEQTAIVDEVSARLSLLEECRDEIVRTTSKAESLRKAILASAFQGTLVPQDPTDEPASRFIDRDKGYPDTAESKNRHFPPVKLPQKEKV